jgi:phage terminase small subunit
MEEIKLSPMHQKFVQEYLKDMNAKAAYIRAGYMARGNRAEASASRLLRHGKVAAAIQQAMDERAARVQITSDSIMEDLRYLADMCLGRKPQPQGIVVDGESVDVMITKLDPAGANKALETLGKHRDFQLWRENKNVTVTTHEEQLETLDD